MFTVGRQVQKPQIFPRKGKYVGKHQSQNTYFGSDCCSSQTNGSLLDIQTLFELAIYNKTISCQTKGPDGICMTWGFDFPHKLQNKSKCAKH